MSRRTFVTILIVIFFLILIVFGIIFYLSTTGKITTFLSPKTSTNNGSSNFDFNSNQDGELQANPANIAEPAANNTPIRPDEIPALRHIYKDPVAGAGFAYIQHKYSTTSINNKQVVITETVPLIRIVDRAKGYIFETATSTLFNTRITNTTVPKTYESLFGIDGNGVLLRTLANDSDTIVSYFGRVKSKFPETITSTTTSSTTGKTTVTTLIAATTTYSSVPDSYSITGDFLSNNIKILTLSPDTNKLFYLSTSEGGATGITLDLLTGQKTAIFSDILTQWNAQWGSADVVTISNLPSGISDGAAYSFNVKTRVLSRLVGPFVGLTALSSQVVNNNTLTLIGRAENDLLTLSSFNEKNKSLVQLALKTLPEKCVWSKKTEGLAYCAVPKTIPIGTYPDAWYQGFVSFNDDIWSINVITGETRIKQRFVAIKPEQQIDGINLMLNKTEDYLIFTNRNDLSLWGLRLINPPKPLPITSTASTTGTSSTVR